jgi:hypothetical protein
MIVHPSEQLFDRVDVQALLEPRMRMHGKIPFQYPDFLRQILRIAPDPSQRLPDVVELAGSVGCKDLSRGHLAQIRQRMREIHHR